MYKTLEYVKRYYYWKSVNQEVKKFVLSCDLCQRVKPVNIQMECAFNRVYSSGPGDLVCVDFYGPLPRSIAGLEYIFVLYDAFSKYLKFYPTKFTSGRHTGNFFINSSSEEQSS